MLKVLFVWSAFVLVACTTGSGDDTSGTPDAPPPVIDAAPGAFGAPCTTVSNTSTECASGVCTDSFDQLPTPVCSEQCTQADPTTCPVGSMGQKCNLEGYCRP
jgi:hypothetical protein